MMREGFVLKTFMRKPPQADRAVRFCHLEPGQPLLLEREPHNPVDSCAVAVSDLMGASVGYIAREHAMLVSDRMASGEVLLARAVGNCQCVARNVLVWSEGEKIEEIERKKENQDA